MKKFFLLLYLSSPDPWQEGLRPFFELQDINTSPNPTPDRNESPKFRGTLKGNIREEQREERPLRPLETEDKIDKGLY